MRFTLARDDYYLLVRVCVCARINIYSYNMILHCQTIVFNTQNNSFNHPTRIYIHSLDPSSRLSLRLLFPIWSYIRVEILFCITTTRSLQYYNVHIVPLRYSRVHKSPSTERARVLHSFTKTTCLRNIEFNNDINTYTYFCKWGTCPL